MISKKIVANENTNDALLLSAAMDALKWLSAVFEKRIELHAQDTCLFLEGEDYREFRKSSANLMIGHHKDVCTVINNIKVVPQEHLRKIREVHNCFSL
ncbi:MAG TPA: hypothetical protein VII99_14915 [Bacteroidia bacterium]